MGDVAQRLLQRMGVDALNRTSVLARQLLYFPHPRIVSPLSEPKGENPLRMPFEQHPHRMYAVNRLGAFQAFSTSYVFDEIKVNEPFYGVDRRNDDPDVSTGSQATPSPAACPRVPVIFHYVLVVSEIVEMQKPINRDIQDLYETSKLHHRCDDAVECLTNTLAEVRALKERRDVPIRLVSTLLQL